MRNIGGKCPVNMANFTRITKTTHPSRRTPGGSDAYVSLNEKAHGARLSLSEEVGDLVVGELGDLVCIHMDEGDRLLLITRDEGDGSARKLSRGTHGRRWALSLHILYDTLRRMFGEHRKVHFDAEVYDGMVLLRPSGEVE